MQDLKGFYDRFPPGGRIVVSDHLSADERLTVYAHLLAHAILEEAPEKPDGLLSLLSLPAHTLLDGAPGDPGGFFSHLEYVDGREPLPGAPAPSSGAEGAATALAQAILRGSLDGVPSYAYPPLPRPRPRSRVAPRPGADVGSS